jgi:hypothetical protein
VAKKNQVEPDKENGIKILAELGALRLSRILFGHLDKKEMERFGYLLLPDVSEDMIDEAEYSLLIDNDAENDPMARRIRNVAAHCSCEVMLSLIELLMLRVTEPLAAELLEIVSPGNGNGVTILTAARASRYTEGIDEAMLPMRDALEAASFMLRCENKGEQLFYRKIWNADPYLLTYLAGESGGETDCSEYIDRVDISDDDIDIFGMEDEVKKLSTGLSKLMDNLSAAEDPSMQCFSVIVEGEKESGRFTAVRAAAAKAQIPILTLDFEILRVLEDPRSAILNAVKMAALEERALCVRNVSKSQDSLFLINRIQKTYRKHCVLPLIFTTDVSVKLIPELSEKCISMQIPNSKATGLKLWQGFLPKKYKKYAQSLSSKMKLTAGQLKKVCVLIETAEESGEKIDEHMICKLCYRVLDDGRYENVKWVAPGFDMEDLKIDDNNRAVLDDICAQIEHRQMVYDDWNLESKYAYGRCVSVIFAGPPGTGKTMAVHALASRMGLELYKVDLSQIADKYIGETEKRLEEVFTKAEKSNMILFFDEADAVMSKRSDVKDSHDKYANTEISFILQRIEKYDGIVILATNNLQNIDNAFMRRIRYVLNFSLPDASVREEIWRGAFAKEVPLSDDIDFEYLAQTFEISGGDIKNIVLNAVFYGAADEGMVTMKHVMKAVHRELTKGRNVALTGNYGKYSYLLV